MVYPKCTSHSPLLFYPSYLLYLLLTPTVMNCLNIFATFLYIIYLIHMLSLILSLLSKNLIVLICLINLWSFSTWYIYLLIFLVRSLLILLCHTLLKGTLISSSQKLIFLTSFQLQLLKLTIF